MADEPKTVKGTILQDPHMFPNATPKDKEAGISVGDEVEVLERDALALSMSGLIQLPEGWKPGGPQPDAGMSIVGDGAEASAETTPKKGAK